MINEIQFHKEVGCYSIGGRFVPRVSNILSVLTEYRPSKKADYAMKRGTAVHKMIELYMASNLNEATLSPALTPYLRAWQSFVDKNELRIDFNAFSMEVMIGSDLGYAGTGDIVTPKWIGDIKTGDEYPTHRHQLHAYMMGAKETIDGKKRDMFNLYLFNDESYRIVVHKWDKLVWEQFKAALVVYNYKTGGKICKIS